MQDLELAKTYFEKAASNGEATSFYNLARLAHMQNSNDHRPVLNYLEHAANSGLKDMEVMYILGLEAFGNDDEKTSAVKQLNQTESNISFFRDDFSAHFKLEETH